MSIDFTQLFTALGSYVGALNETNTYRGTVDTRVQTIIALGAPGLNPSILSGIYDAENSTISAQSGWLQYLQGLSRNTLIAAVNDDRPIVNDLPTAWTELIRQMVLNTESLASIASSIVVTPSGSNVGNGIVALTAKDGSGVAQDLMLPDVYFFQVTTDRSRGGTNYSEGLSIKGTPQANSPTDASYPLGTAVNTSTNFYNPASPSFSLTVDPAFANWSTNTPTNWTIASGTAGTNVFQQADDPYGGAGLSARLHSTGSLIKLRQTITVTPNTVYAIAGKVKVATDAGTHGQVTLSLVDGSGNVITDVSGGNCTVTSPSTASIADSAWHSFQGFVVTPTVTPTQVNVEIRFHKASTFATGADNTNEVYVDHVHMSTAKQLYTSGPYYFAYSSTIPAVTGDLYTATVTIPSSGAAYPLRLVVGLDRLLNIRNLSPRIPTSGSPTQDDSLVS